MNMLNWKKNPFRCFKCQSHTVSFFLVFSGFTSNSSLAKVWVVYSTVELSGSHSAGGNLFSLQTAATTTMKRVNHSDTSTWASFESWVIRFEKYMIALFCTFQEEVTFDILQSVQDSTI